MKGVINIDNQTPSPTPSETQLKSEFLQMWEAYQQVKTNSQPTLLYDWNAFNKATTTRTFDSKGKKYTKDDIRNYLSKPETSEKQIRDCSIYLYNSISEYKHLIDYMSKMLTHDYVLVPDNIIATAEERLIKSFYKNLEFIENYNIKHKLSSIESILLREDFYFGYELSDGQNFVWQRLPSDFCRLLGWDEWGALTFEFDFSYFGKQGLKLDNFDPEFTEKYNIYKGDGKQRWQQLSDKAICFKFDLSTLYGLPYFSGLFTGLMGLEDYKDDQEDTSRANNYKLIALEIPIDKDKGINHYLVSLDHVTNFVNNASRNTPANVGIFASPLKAEALNLNNTNAQFEETMVNKAQNDLFSSAGVSKLVGNSEKTSVGLERSINDDEAVMFGLLRQYELWFKKRLRMFNKVGYKWKLQFIDKSFFNKDKVFDMYLKSGNVGMPKAQLIASMGYSQSDFINLAKLESQLDLSGLLEVLPSSATTPGDDGGRPGKSVDDKADQSVVSDDLETNKQKNFEEEE